ncbi:MULTISPECIES: hypothetical protein [Prochlorococcus]|nr:MULTISPECIES: hypothetical protein [Prochlorococcus]KGG13847.1 hypothetical protein EV04_0332 [Prochlorococcus marinus str. LG]KGG18980.1 hypothetical protein EV08_1467 [Prochlorococcus marinus str. SS2]KGG23480.1 hypothetical protein EV09_1104 [Prochlorococcus marinus str. SS35]KGG32284.1 hypothetical protein EV10_1399 [Prochlorococcus marinus str. SS51]KGG35024.1 hypothetical protein EV11_1426 [Prochlorococcus sp. SS52]
MHQQFEDKASLGNDSVEDLGFESEEDLLDALIPLMQELDLEDMLVA